MDVEVLNLDVDEFRRVLNEYRIEVEDEQMQLSVEVVEDEFDDLVVVEQMCRERDIFVCFGE